MTSDEVIERIADWLNAFKADPFATGADKAGALLELVGTLAKSRPVEGDVVERVARAICIESGGDPEPDPSCTGYGPSGFDPSRDEVSDESATDPRIRIRQEIINTPETADFMAGVPIEAAHQRERWGSEHDAGKTPFDWFWLVGYLAQKAASAAVAGDTEKAKHHTISTAAALANWHAALTGADTSMRPGIEEPSNARAA